MFFLWATLWSPSERILSCQCSDRSAALVLKLRFFCSLHSIERQVVNVPRDVSQITVTAHRCYRLTLCFVWRCHAFTLRCRRECCVVYALFPLEAPSELSLFFFSHGRKMGAAETRFCDNSLGSSFASFAVRPA